jgi:hypothetical protein
VNQPSNETHLSQGEYLRQRNALWRQLREFQPDDPRAEAVILELMRLTGMTREKVLEGLGWT